MKVLISGHETCGLIHDLAEDLSLRGNSVITVAKPQAYVSYEYDYDQYALPVSYLSSKIGGKRLWSSPLQILWEVSPRAHQALEQRFRLQLVADADLYIQVWGGIPFERELLEFASRRKTRIATLFMGSDVREYDVFGQQYQIEGWDPPPAYRSVPLARKLEILRTHERFSDAIFSVPDQMGLALRPYHHLQIPLSLDRFRFNVSQRAIPRVIHAPTVPHVKGTDKIEAALETLRAEGIQFDLVSVRDMQHTELLQLLSESDVLVDEVICHGPGWLSFEAMASGCAVATRYLENSPEVFRPPVWAIDERNLVDRLRTLLTDAKLRMRLANEGRRYVERNNGAQQVVNTLLAKVEEGRSANTDYEPEYLLRNYQPPSRNHSEAINRANALVSGEEWYRQRARGRLRDGLEF